MERISNLTQAQEKVFEDMCELMEVLRDLSADISSLNDGIQRLQAIRAKLYENLNQIQHEYLIIQGIQWLQARGYTGDGVEWYWNPRQTGDSREPDLLAKK